MNNDNTSLTKLQYNILKAVDISDANDLDLSLDGLFQQLSEYEKESVLESLLQMNGKYLVLSTNAYFVNSSTGPTTLFVHTTYLTGPTISTLAKKYE